MVLDEVALQVLTEIFGEWVNNQRRIVLKSNTLVEASQDTFKIIKSSKLKPFKVKIVPINQDSSFTIKEQQPLKYIASDSKQEHQAQVNRIFIKKSRSIALSVKAKQTPGKDRDNLNEISANRCSQTEKELPQPVEDAEELDFEAILEKAKRQLGITNWQRTESAKRRERLLTQKMEQDHNTLNDTQKISIDSKLKSDSDLDSDSDQSDVAVCTSRFKQVMQKTRGIPVLRPKLPQKTVVSTSNGDAVQKQRTMDLKSRLLAKQNQMEGSIATANDTMMLKVPFTVKGVVSTKNGLLKQSRTRFFTKYDSEQLDYSKVNMSNPMIASPTRTFPTKFSSPNDSIQIIGPSPDHKHLSTRNLNRKVFNFKSSGIA